METLLSLKHIHKSFIGVRALTNANLNVYKGRVMALVGENGAGKSTLMKILTGIYHKNAGQIIYLGKQVEFKGPKHSQQAGIGIIHQELNLISEMTIAENIFLGREFTGYLGKINWKKTHQEATRLLQKLNLNYNSQTKIADLSIGEQQMVEIAKVLSFKSQVIIMDEPTDALTDTETQALFKVIKELKANGCGIVYISHRMKEIFDICDDVTILRDGEFIAELPVNQLNEDKLIEMMVGRKLEEQYPKVSTHFDENVLEVNNLSAIGVDNVSFILKKGEILGIAGLMGAGRTELMKAIYGAIPLKSGTIKLNNKMISPKSPADGLKNGIVYITEDRKKDGLILGMSVKDNMSLTSLKSLSTPFGSITLKQELKSVLEFINSFNIKTPSVNQIIGHLSGGNQQKVAIARGLMTDPKVLILDEPTRGVDVGAKKEIYQLINQFKQAGLSIILISSDMPEVLGMSDRVMVIHEGTVTLDENIKGITQERIMAAAVGQV